MSRSLKWGTEVRLCDRLESQDAAGVNATIGLTKGDTILEQQQREEHSAKSALFSAISLNLPPLFPSSPVTQGSPVCSCFSIFCHSFTKKLICDERKWKWRICAGWKQRIHISSTSSHLSTFPLAHQHNGQITLNQFVPSSGRKHENWRKQGKGKGSIWKSLQLVF